MRVLTDRRPTVPLIESGKSKMVAHTVRTEGVAGVLSLLRSTLEDADLQLWCCDALSTLTELNGVYTCVHNGVSVCGLNRVCICVLHHVCESVYAFVCSTEFAFVCLTMCVCV
jgi:hypothetical protein